MKAVYSGNHGRECNTYCRFSEKVKSKFKALNVFVFVFVFLDKFNLFQIKSVVVGIAQSTEITTKHSDFTKNLQLSAASVSSWACNSISHFWCKEIQISSAKEIQISSAKEIQISSAKESRAGSSLEQLQHSLLPSYSKYRGKKYSRGW